MDRRDWFFRQRVTEAEMGDADDQIENAIWNLMKDALGFGFLTGGVVVEHSTPADLTVDLGQFLGYDQLGQRLLLLSGSAPEVVNCAIDEVAASTAVSTPGNEKTLALFVEFDRALSEPRLDGNGVTVQYKVDEAFKVNVVQSAEAALGTSVPPPLRTDQILVADVLLIFGQTQILNADIDQSRKEDFTFSAFLHGGAHRELGIDPVPNATTSDGGLLSGTDKTKLDGITWTPAGIAAQLGFMGRGFNPANVVAPSATTLVVTAEMAAKTPGGNATTKGVITDAPDNLVKIFDDDRDSFLDTNGNKVYGRITEAASVWTLSFFTIVEGTPGVETAFDMTPFAAQTIIWYVQEVFSFDSFPVADPMFAVQSDQIAGEVPDATTTVKGKVELATDGEVAANVVVQGNDSRLTGASGITFIRKMASRPSLIFMPNDTTPFTKYRLHQLHGLARGDYQAGAPWQPADFYFEIDPADVDYPTEVFFTPWPTPDAQPGRADNTKPTGAQDTFYFVYVIGRTSGSPRYALVFSDRAPWVGGPLLDNSDFAFQTNGWRYWRFVAALVNGSASAWELLVVRKIGNHVEYELAQLMYAPDVSADRPWENAPLASRVPPSSMRAHLRAYVTCDSTDLFVMIRPPNNAPGTMGLNEVPSVLKTLEYKLKAHAGETGGGFVAEGSDTGWVALNTAREVGFRFELVGGAGANKKGEIHLLGYEEFDDVANAELSFG